MVKCGIRELLATRLPDLEKHQHRVPWVDGQVGRGLFR